jgi:hypothetical protein
MFYYGAPVFKYVPIANISPVTFSKDIISTATGKCKQFQSAGIRIAFACLKKF